MVDTFSALRIAVQSVAEAGEGVFASRDGKHSIPLIPTRPYPYFAHVSLRFSRTGSVTICVEGDPSSVIHSKMSLPLLCQMRMTLARPQ